MKPLYQPPENCPNDAICIEDEVQRRRSSDKGEWVRWAVGIMLAILTSMVAWAFGRIGTHETTIGIQGTEIRALKDSDIQIHDQLKAAREEQNLRLIRIEDKLDTALREKHK